MPRGAPRGNQNARKHGFYSKALVEAEREALSEAVCVDGIDEEIALLRVRLRAVVAEQPQNVELQLAAVNTLARLLKTRYQLTAEQKNSLKESLFKVMTELAIPLGLKVITGAPR